MIEEKRFFDDNLECHYEVYIFLPKTYLFSVHYYFNVQSLAAISHSRTRKQFYKASLILEL